MNFGGSAPIIRDMNGEFAGRAPIIYGGNLLPAEIVRSSAEGQCRRQSPEQVSEESIWINSRYTSILKAMPVLDYSPRNRENLAAGGDRSRRCARNRLQPLLFQPDGARTSSKI